jgi:hypothetical protein
MVTVFDIVTVACFAGLAVAFFRFTDQDSRTLMHFVLAAIVLAVANQVGNGGSTLLASVLVIAGLGYTYINIRRSS